MKGNCYGLVSENISVFSWEDSGNSRKVCQDSLSTERNLKPGPPK